MTVLHLGGIPELAMALGPVLLIAVFVRIARRAEAAGDDDRDDWDDWDDDEPPSPGLDAVHATVHCPGVQPASVRGDRE
jgi:hypothetical protein